MDVTIPPEWVVEKGISIAFANVYATEDDALLYRRFFYVSWQGGVRFDRLQTESRRDMLAIVNAAWEVHRRWRAHDQSVYTHCRRSGELLRVEDVPESA